ncbi:tRNA pseudouridine(13) synthase TruD [Candidatus Bathyarchaeota archaeon]|nr:tRNA pseudouridine(13) synthase TruD [Candidatus Bathyarchaeota archaeon]
MFVPLIEKKVGIEVYATTTPGIGGVLRHFPEDFVVEEVLLNGLKASVKLKDKIIPSPEQQSRSKFERYLLCVLIKRDKDTFLAVKALARSLRVRDEDINIAGIKDTKALTAQFITIRNVSQEDVKKITIEGVELHPIGYFHTKISSRYLLGNQFRVVIRSVRKPKYIVKERIERTLEELKKHGGIPNFFGHQRFGTIRPITHLVGKAIIKGNFEEAVMVFLAKATPNESPELQIVRKKLWETRNFNEALREFPKKLYYERVMLNHLIKRPEDFIGALKRLPRKLLKLFPQAYQAYLFNKFLSRRIAIGVPLNAAEIGDYVVSVDPLGLPSFKFFKVTSYESRREVNDAISAGKLRIAIPIVGFGQQLSGGLQGEIEREILEEEGVDINDFKVKSMPELRLKGGLRTIVTPVNEFSIVGIYRDEANPGKWKVDVNFMLHRGSYATILLREVMKARNPVKAGF